MQTPKRPLTIFFSAGEPSGDLHGANLIRELTAKGDVSAVGFGGPLMAAAGCRLHAELTLLAVMGILPVLAKLPQFLKLLLRADRVFRTERPDAVVLIDFPGFNWWIARRAKRHGIPVFYHVPPQIWAWYTWRVRRMRKLVDHVLCGLEFETRWLQDHGCRATFVGHPYFDEVRRQSLDRPFMDERRGRPGPLVAILPGSRTQEVVNNLPWQLKAAAQVRAAVPGVRFAIAAFKDSHAELARSLAADTDLDIEVCVGKTPELIALSTCALAVSGSVSLELMHQEKPTVIIYQVARRNRWALALVSVKYITLVNLLADDDPLGKRAGVLPEKALFPEYLTCDDKSHEIAAQLVEWLTDPVALAERVAALARLKAQVAHPGASRRAAEYILETLGGGREIPKPHFAAALSQRAKS